MSEVANSGRGLTQNQAIQASHHIVGLLERSKNMLEHFLDDLPQVFVVFDSRGRIYKANRQAASVLGCQVEDALGRNLSDAFTPEAWEIFLNEATKLENESGGLPLGEFELSTRPVQGVSTVYLWSLRPFFLQSKARSGWFVALAQDISITKAFERQLSQIFSSIPLGVLQSDAEGNVLSPYSKFAEVLLGRATLAGAKLFDVLFKPAWEGMAIEEREKAMNVLNCLGFSEIQFDLAKDDLLSRVRLPAEGGLPEHQRVLGVRYEPIVHAGRLDGLLVILDDRTELEKLNAEKAKRRSKDAFLGECFCELRALDSSVRETVISDIQGFVADMARTSRAREVLNLFRAIHSVKGTARIAGLETLKSVAHAVESDFLTGRTSAGEVDWDRLLPKLLELSEIFAQYQKVNVGVDAIVTAENSRAADAPRVEGRKVAAWEQVFSQTVQKTALQVGKSVRFEFQCDSFSLSDARWRLLREALLHILNNAVDHGAEATLEERVKQGKPKETTVRLEIHRRDNGGVEVLVEDDGKGFDRDRILAKAVVQGLITRDVVCDLTEEATLALLLKPGFSTRDTATEVSGRGVGLDVVRQIVEQLGGYLSLSRRQPWGSRFKITLNGE